MTEANTSKFIDIVAAGNPVWNPYTYTLLFGRREDGTLAVCKRGPRNEEWREVTPPRPPGTPIRQIRIAAAEGWPTHILYVLYEDGSLYERYSGFNVWNTVVEPHVAVRQI